MDAMESRSRWFAPRLFFGLVVITLGLIALLDNLGVIDVRDPFRFWPLGLIALGFARLLRPAGSPGRWTGGLLVVVGGWILLHNLNVIAWSLFAFWPILLVLVGARLVWGAASRHTERGLAATDTAPQLSAFAMLGGAEHKVSSPDFKGGDATAVLGGCKLDLRQAVIKDGQAVIDVFALWGGIEIIVPQDWSLVSLGTPILGAFEDKTRPPQGTTGPRLIIKGVAIMGGVEIKN